MLLAKSTLYVQYPHALALKACSIVVKPTMFIDDSKFAMKLILLTHSTVNES